VSGRRTRLVGGVGHEWALGRRTRVSRASGSLGALSVGEVRPPRLEWANSLRGVAAVLVVVSHLGIVFWTRQADAAGLARRPSLHADDEGVPRFAQLLSALPVDLGAFGVGLFFLLSGYVIAISLDKYSRGGFLVGRCMRLLPTYAAAYLVTCLVIALVGDPKDELSVGSVLTGSIPGLQYLLGVPAPGNGILWTLIVELVFYGVCLVTYRSLTRRWEAIALVAAGCILLQLLVDAPAALEGSSVGGVQYIVLLSLPFLPVLLIGVTLSGRSRGHIGAAATTALVPALALVHLGLMVTSEVNSTTRLYKLTFLGVIVLFCVVWAWGDRWRGHAVTDFAADISYPLYVVHPVLGYALLSVLAGYQVEPTLALLIAAAVVVAAASLLHHLVEKPTHRLGQRWTHRTRDRYADAGSTVPTPPAPAPAGSLPESLVRTVAPAPCLEENSGSRTPEVGVTASVGR
jgi:peptidoglycan/LPS O-acetylase OafA/YrhL